MSITVLQLHKRASEQYKNIQDKYSFNPANGTFALADGTTQSYNSEIWAEIITTEFVERPTFDSKQIIANFKNCVPQYSNHTHTFSTNPAIASLQKVKMQKGGTATFIGIRITESRHIDCISCGDSNLFIIKKNNTVSYFPFANIDTLDKNDFFLNSEQLRNDKIQESFFSHSVFECEPGDIVILATDALSRFIFNYPHRKTEFLAITDFQGLLRFCMNYWESKELEEDDISAVVIKLDNGNAINYILPDSGFTFPKERLFPGGPPSTQKLTADQSSPANFSDMQFNEITQQINAVRYDLAQARKKQKLAEMLLMAAIGLLVASLFLIFYLRPAPVPAEPNASDIKASEQYQAILTKIGTLEQSIENNNQHPVVNTVKKNREKKGGKNR